MELQVNPLKRWINNTLRIFEFSNVLCIIWVSGVGSLKKLEVETNTLETRLAKSDPLPCRVMTVEIKETRGKISYLDAE